MLAVFAIVSCFHVPPAGNYGTGDTIRMAPDTMCQFLEGITANQPLDLRCVVKEQPAWRSAD